MLQLLGRAKVVERPQARMDSPLHAACINGDVSALAGMLSAVSSRSANDPDTVLGWCPLHFAAQFGRQQVVELLLAPPVRMQAATTQRRSALRPRTLPNAVRVCGRRRSPHSHQRQWTRRRRQVRRRCTWRRPMGTPLWCSACCNTAPPSITATINWVTPHCILRLLKHAPAWSRCWYNMAPMVSNSLAGALGDHSAAHASLLLCPAPVERPQDVTHGLRMRYVLVRSACRR